MCEWPKITASASGNQRAQPLEAPARPGPRRGQRRFERRPPRSSPLGQQLAAALSRRRCRVRRRRGRSDSSSLSTDRLEKSPAWTISSAPRQPLDAGVRQAPVSSRHVCVGDDGDLHGRFRDLDGVDGSPPIRPVSLVPHRRAPVAQGIERSPPERKVAGSNPAGRATRALPCEWSATLFPPG